MHLEEHFGAMLCRYSVTGGVQASTSRAVERFGRRLSACPWEFSKRLQALGQAARLAWTVDGLPIPSCAARSKDFTALSSQMNNLSRLTSAHC